MSACVTLSLASDGMPFIPDAGNSCVPVLLFLRACENGMGKGRAGRWREGGGNRPLEPSMGGGRRGEGRVCHVKLFLIVTVKVTSDK